MRKRCKIILLFLSILSVFLFSGQALKEKDLSERYQEWLKLASYIILPVEREVFLQLTNDRDRDIFIESFWRQRDPTPGTPQNEFKDEHVKRFLYANKYLGRGTPQEGWMTDMGRIHIILGPPASIERFDSQAGIHPCQVWYYYGNKEKNLPTYFAIVFYQRGGSGEFKLYNPVSDGPISLLIDTKGIDLTDYESIYEKIKELAPTLANVSISMIPGQYPYNFMPSPQNNIILANIFESPRKDISASYATHFLHFKGIVSTEYLTNYVESSAAVALIYEPVLRLDFLHFSIAPKRLSIDYYRPKDQYFCNFMLNVSLRKGQDIVFQYSKDFPFYFPPDRVENIRGNGISVQDSFPIVEGEYELTILLQNSVGKEFSLYEKTIVIQRESNDVLMEAPLLGYKLQDYPTSSHSPFKVANKQMFIDPSNTFSVKDDLAFLLNLYNVSEELWKEGEVAVNVKGLNEKTPFQKSFFLRLDSLPFHSTLVLTQSFPVSEFPPDYYEINFSLKDGKGNILDKKSSNFIISPAEAVPHPVTLAKSFPLSNNFLYVYTVAYQYMKVSEPQKAEAFFEKAISLNPDYKEGIVEYAHFLLGVKKFDRALELVERIRVEEKLQFDYYLLKGKALEGKGECAKAIESLLEGNKIYDSDTRLLNSLGNCYYRTRQKERALEVLKASLRLNPDQGEVKELIARIEKEL